MASPVFDPTLHDVGINGLGYILPPDGPVVEQDAIPSTSRAALGEGRYDLYLDDSFYAQATSAGGAGQTRLLSTDSYLSGVCDSRWSGHLFPARKLIAAANNGGTASFMFHRDSTVYGFASGGDIEQFGSNTTFTGLGTVPRHRPVVDGNNYMFYVTTDNKLGKWTGSGSVSNITSNLGTNVTPYVVANYHRYLWCLATRVYESTPTLVQGNSTQGTATTLGFQFKKRPVSGNLLVMTITVYGDEYPETVPAGWILADSDTTSAAVQGYVYYKAAEPNEKVGGQIRFLDGGGGGFFSSSSSVIITVSEWEGVDSNAILDTYTHTIVGGAVSTLTGGSITTTEADTLVLFIGMTNNASGSDIATATNYTDAVEVGRTADATDRVAIQYRALSATGTESPSVTEGAGTQLGFIMAFKGNTITSDVTQFSTLYSSDAGASWNLAFSDMGTGVDAPTAAHAAGGSLWFTTPRGLYQMGIEDEEFVDGHTKLNIFLRGKIDTFNVPAGTANIGLWLADWTGALYYGVGQTVRSFPLGAQGQAEGRQVWPTEDWGTAGGDVGAVVAGEGGVYFGGGPTLWCYNQRGFHPLATNSTSGIYNHLYWHAGRLYVTKDPAEYYDFGYPSLRPDIYTTASTNFETSYWVSSLIDFEKMDVYKHLSQFQTVVEFSAIANSGEVVLEYLTADTGIHPDRLGGGATSLSWVEIGRHTVSDGNVKTYTPSVIKAKAIYLRLSWTVGASGYAIPQAVVANGRSVMPQVDRLIIPLMLANDVRNKVGALMYPTTTDVWTARDELRDLRRGDNAFTVKIMDDDGGVSALTVTAEQFQGRINRFKKGNRAVTGDAQLVVKQLPGTTVTETRP